MPTDYKKYIVWIAVALIAMVILIVIYKKSSKSIKTALNKKQQDRILNLEIQTNNRVLTDSEINDLVAKLKVAFDGFGTDEDAVFSVFEALETRDDYLALKKAFGMYEDKSLTEWLADEMNKTELAHIQEILSVKGITVAI